MAPSELSRRTFVRSLAVVGGAFVLAPVLAACSTGAKPSSTDAFGRPVRGGTATIAIQDNPVNMDPADGQLYSSIQVYE